MVKQSVESLKSLVSRILVAAGASDENARLVSEHLVLANLSGVDTHGICHVEKYVKAIQDGDLLPAASPAVLEETPTTALISGNWTFGHVAGRRAMQVAIEKASDQQVAVVGLVQTHHVGRLGHFTEMAAEAGMLSMVWAGGLDKETPTAFPFGGRRPLLHTNPIAMGVPGGEHPSMSYDFATSATSGMKVENAHRRGEQVPSGCIVDKHGTPTNDPKDFYDDGGHIAFGGHKGWAQMLASEYLGRIFTGSDAHADPQRGGSGNRHQGVTMNVMKADMFQPWSHFQERAAELAQRTRDIPPAHGFDEVLVPGDPEKRTHKIRSRDGIPIEDDVWEALVQVAELVGVAV